MLTDQTFASPSSVPTKPYPTGRATPSLSFLAVNGRRGPGVFSMAYVAYRYVEVPGRAAFGRMAKWLTGPSRSSRRGTMGIVAVNEPLP